MIELGVAFERNPELSWTEMDGEAVVLDAERGEYAGLGGIGGRIWELLAEPITATELREIIVTEFEVHPETCEQDLLAFLDQLLASDMIRRS